jgi:hypothetical protein
MFESKVCKAIVIVVGILAGVFEGILALNFADVK